ncbi:MAG: alginate lyase family protein [Aggregatilineales bacterium]
MFSPHHFGLYFTSQQVKNAHKHKDREPFKTAWVTLRDTNPLDPLQALLWNGLRYRFDGKVDAGEFTVSQLENHLATHADDVSVWNALAQTLLLAQCMELVRDHPAKSDATEARWRDLLFERVGGLNNDTNALTFAESVWKSALNMATGVVLEREPIFQQAVDEFKAVIDNEIHPQGYLPRAIDPSSGGQSLLNHLRVSQGLVLMAEMGRCVDVDLWGYANRGVSITTTTTYPLYYFFYPEKWKWVEERYMGGKKVEAEVLGEDESQRMFKNNAGFLEMLNHHYGNQPLRAVQMILEELRPVNDLFGGGLTTLTHGYVEGRRGLFG